MFLSVALIGINDLINYDWSLYVKKAWLGRGSNSGPLDPGAQTLNRWATEALSAVAYSEYIFRPLFLVNIWLYIWPLVGAGPTKFLSYRVKDIKLHGYIQFGFKNIKRKSNSIFGRNPMATLLISLTEYIWLFVKSFNESISSWYIEPFDSSFDSTSDHCRFLRFYISLKKWSTDNSLWVIILRRRKSDFVI